jgi:hypothetical protein
VTAYRLGINTCFAVKRWPEPQRWVRQAPGGDQRAARVLRLLARFPGRARP